MPGRSFSSVVGLAAVSARDAVCRCVHVLSGSPRARKCPAVSPGPILSSALLDRTGERVRKAVEPRRRPSDHESGRGWLAQDLALSVQCFCTGLVALGAAYVAYRHGREFALRFGADTETASVWLLLVDGLPTIATVELWKAHRGGGGSGRWVAWLAFVFGICLSLVANICSAPALSLLQVTVAACPPLALLLAVELFERGIDAAVSRDWLRAHWCW